MQVPHQASAVVHKNSECPQSVRLVQCNFGLCLVEVWLSSINMACSWFSMPVSGYTHVHPLKLSVPVRCWDFVSGIGSGRNITHSASSVSEAESMKSEDDSTGPRNVLGGPLQACCTEPGKVCCG